MNRARFKSRLPVALTWLAAVSAGGCHWPTIPVGPRPVAPLAPPRSEPAPDLQYRDLAVVLADVVRDEGQIEPVAVRRTRDALTRQWQRLACHGPTATPSALPTAEDKLAYWLNARATCALAILWREGFPRRLPPAALDDRLIRLDGRDMTLRRIDEELHRLAGWRGVVAAPSIRAQRAQLPREPYDPATVRKQLARHVERFIDDEKRFVIDYEGKTVRVPPVFWQFRKEIHAEHCGLVGVPGACFLTCLLKVVGGSAHRRLQDALGLTSRCADVDQTLSLPKFRAEELEGRPTTRPAR